MGATPSFPLLTRASRPLTFETHAVNEKGETVGVSVAGEHPLTLYVDEREIVTLMTLGACPEALAIGYLRNQRLVGSLEEIASVQVDWDVNAAAVRTRQGLAGAAGDLQRRTVTTGGQGTMFGDLMRDVESMRVASDARLDQERLFALNQEVRQLQTIHKQAGAVHGCALIRNGAGGLEVLMVIDDVGRHNTVDAIAGRMWLESLEGGDKILFTTGRLTSEMVIKTAQMGIPFLISRNGITQMGWEIARHTGITAIGRAQGRHYLIYTGAERFSQ